MRQKPPKNIVLDTFRHVTFEGNKLVRSHTPFTEWIESQAVANIVTACSQFKTYDNVSTTMYDYGFSTYVAQGGIISITTPPIIASRYPSAAQLMMTAIMLDNTDNLCSVLDSPDALVERLKVTEA